MKLILLTDDNKAMDKRLEELLRKENYKVNVSEWNGISIAIAREKEQEGFDEKTFLKQVALQIYRESNAITGNLLEFDEICMDLLTHEVTIHHQPIKLTKTEYAILKLLLQHPFQVLQKWMFLEKIGNYTPDCVENSLKVHISNLRKKLKEVTGKDYIEAVRGVGFMLVNPVTK